MLNVEMSFTASEREGIRFRAAPPYRDSKVLHTKTLKPATALELARGIDLLLAPEGVIDGEPGPLEALVVKELRELSSAMAKSTRTHLVEGTRMTELGAAISEAIAP